MLDTIFFPCPNLAPAIWLVVSICMLTDFDTCVTGPAALLAATSLWPFPLVQHPTRRLCSCQLPFWPTICTLAPGCSKPFSCMFYDDLMLASNLAIALDACATGE